LEGFEEPAEVPGGRSLESSSREVKTAIGDDNEYRTLEQCVADPVEAVDMRLNRSGGLEEKEQRTESPI
jgi:hypothetical protein